MGKPQKEPLQELAEVERAALQRVVWASSERVDREVIWVHRTTEDSIAELHRTGFELLRLQHGYKVICGIMLADEENGRW